MLYYVQTQKQVILVTIYSKSDQSDIVADEVRHIISDYEQ